MSESGVRRLTDLAMASPRTGIAVWTPSMPGPQYSLLATEDGGRHWLPVGQSVGTALRAVDFVDLSTGCGSDREHVYRTTDGARSWVLADPPCGAERVCFIAADDGWAARDAHVFRTIDGGRTWMEAFELPVQASDNQCNANSIHIQSLECARPGLVWVRFTRAGGGRRADPVRRLSRHGGRCLDRHLKARGGPPHLVAARRADPTRHHCLSSTVPG